jgi:small subunit ribosomal protein S20
LANSPQARKRVRQSIKRTQHTSSMRTKLRTYIKKVRSAIASKDLSAAKSSFSAAQKIIDNMVNKKILHSNTAARYKSNLNKAIKSISA